MSVSSSRRYSLSASSTPARKAPSAIDSPTACISAAVPTTRPSAAAVKISGVWLRAIQRSAGRIARRPPSTITAIMPNARAAAINGWPASAPATRSGAISGISASSGIAAMSWNSDTLSTDWPAVVCRMLRSLSVASPMAVDDMASAAPATTANCQPSGQNPMQAQPIAAISARLPISCALPQPKIGRRIAHSRLGSSSRPIRNSISTTPNSARSTICDGSVTRRRPHGPIAKPAPR